MFVCKIKLHKFGNKLNRHRVLIKIRCILKKRIICKFCCSKYKKKALFSRLKKFLTDGGLSWPIYSK